MIVNVVMIIVLTVASGLSDAWGLLHASNIWQDGKLVTDELVKSAIGFTGGITLFWLALRFMKEVGIVSPEIQSTIWFAVMMVGVAIANREFFKWQVTEQIVAVLVIGGILWLTIRTGQ